MALLDARDVVYDKTFGDVFAATVENVDVYIEENQEEATDHYEYEPQPPHTGASKVRLIYVVSFFKYVILLLIYPLGLRSMTKCMVKSNDLSRSQMAALQYGTLLIQRWIKLRQNHFVRLLLRT